MVYKIENQRIILNNGELFKVTGVASSLSNERGGFADIEIITERGKYTGTIEKKYLKKAEIKDIVSIVFLKDGLAQKEFSTNKEAIDALSNEFASAYELEGDGQEAYNYLFDFRMMHLLDDFDFVYTVTGGNYSIEIGETEESIDEIIQSVRDVYNVNVSSLDEAISEVENNIDNTMSNVGCDPYTALRLEKEDGISESFKIVPISDTAYVELMEDIIF